MRRTPKIGPAAKLCLWRKSCGLDPTHTNKMKAKRKRHDPEFKARVALEALKGIKPIQQIAREHDIHPVQVSEWKKALLEGLPGVFGQGRDQQKFEDMSHDKVKSVAFEIAVLGQGGLDINAPDAQYTLKSLPGTYSGLRLVSMMYVGFKVINPSLDGGIDLSREYAHARKLAGLA